VLSKLDEVVLKRAHLFYCYSCR